MILGLQVAAIVFSLTMIYLAVLHFKKGEIDSMEIASWIVIWVITIFIVVFPDIVRVFAQSFAISRLLDLLIAGGFVLVISMVASSYVKSRRIEKKLEDFIRKEALKDVKKKNRK